MSNEAKFKWKYAKWMATEKIKRIVACNTLLASTYFNKRLQIHTNARNLQIGAVILSAKKADISLSKESKRYTVTEKELLRIVGTFK